MRNFRELRVWLDSVDLASHVYQVTQSFPKEEEFGITRQIRRCVVSIASNIAEGCSRSSDRDFCHFLEIGVGSSFEAETQLIIAHRVGFLNQQYADDCLTQVRQVQRSLSTLIKRTRSQIKH